MFFLTVRRGPTGVRRRIAAVWESDGHGEHRQIADDRMTLEDSQLVSPATLIRASKTIDQLLASGARTIEQVRGFVTPSQR